MSKYDVFSDLFNDFLHNAFLLHKEFGDEDATRVFKLGTLNRAFSPMIMYPYITKHMQALKEAGVDSDDIPVMQDTMAILYSKVIDELRYVVGAEITQVNLAYCILETMEHDIVPYKTGWLHVAGKLLAEGLVKYHLIDDDNVAHPIYTVLVTTVEEFNPTSLAYSVEDVSAAIDPNEYDVLLSFVQWTDELLNDY
jgi:hypothetical protein